LKYPSVKIYLDLEIPAEDVTSLVNSQWCETNQRRFVHAAEIYGFGAYLMPKIVFAPPFTLVRSETTCLACRQTTPVVAVEATGYVPLSSKGHDLALAIALFMQGEIDNALPHPVFLTNVREYPPEFLKPVRMSSFLFRKYNLGEDNDCFANACTHCKTPIDDFTLFYEQDGPLARCNPCPTRLSGTILNYNLPIVAEAQFA
jgi:hypothetical protein